MKCRANHLHALTSCQKCQISTLKQSHNLHMAQHYLLWHLIICEKMEVLKYRQGRRKFHFVKLIYTGIYITTLWARIYQCIVH